MNSSDTKSLEDLTKEDVESMNYNQLISLVKETNRPPGGLKSIVRIAQNAFITDKTKVLEIGTSTGITAIELARLTGAYIHGIDINERSLDEARNRAKRYKVESKTNFYLEDATALSFKDESYDVVFCGNVTSLISNRKKALNEYSRVLRTGGILAAIPMYYVKEPSKQLIADVSRAIQVDITPHYKDYWTDFFSVDPFHTYITEDYVFDDIPAKEVDSFVDNILSRSHLQKLNPEAKKELDKKYREYMHLFRDNLSQMGYSLMLLRKEPELTDPELFTSSRIGLQ